MSVSCECCVLSGRGLCDELITRQEESYWLVRRFVCTRNLVNEEGRGPLGAVAPNTKIQMHVIITIKSVPVFYNQFFFPPPRFFSRILVIHFISTNCHVVTYHTFIFVICTWHSSLLGVCFIVNIALITRTHRIGFAQGFQIITLWIRTLYRVAITSRMVAVSIPYGVIGICHWHNPSGRTMALGSTHSLTEMSTRNISLVGKGGRCVGLTSLPPSCADCI